MAGTARAAAGPVAPQVRGDHERTEPRSGDGSTFRGINAIRACVLSIVVAFHVLFSATTPKWVIGALFHLSWVVSMFFVLSGFLIFRPFASALYRGRPVNIRAYAQNRALRILPLYILASTAALLVYPGRRHLSLVFFTATFTGTYVNRPIYDLLAPISWALDNDIWYYLLLPVLYTLVVRLVAPARRFAWMAALIVILALVSFTLQMLMLWRTGFHPKVGYSYNLYRMMPSQFFIFAAGMLLAMYQIPRGVRFLRTRSVVLLTVAALAVLVAAYASYPRVYFAVGLLYGAGMTLILAAVVMAAPSSRLIALLSMAAPVYLGEISYGIYLWHPIVLDSIRDRGLLPANYWAALTVVYIASVAVASASYHVVERPALRHKRRWMTAAT